MTIFSQLIESETGHLLWFVGFIIVALVTSEIGFRHGHNSVRPRTDSRPRVTASTQRVNALLETDIDRPVGPAPSAQGADMSRARCVTASVKRLAQRCVIHSIV